MSFLGDVVSRARGLSTHLLGRADFARLAQAADRGAFSRALEELGYAVADHGGDPAASRAERIDAAIGRGGARRLAVLARWLRGRRAWFAGVFEEEDRRALRALLRGVASGEPASSVTAGLAPSAGLPRRALASLEPARDLPDLVARLGRCASPYAKPLADALAGAPGDLLALEIALDRAFAERAGRGARRGDAGLRAWVAEGIDLENAWHALLGGTSSFVPGGRVLDRARHDAVLREREPSARRQRLAHVFARGPLGAVFGDAAASVASLEGRALAARVIALRRAARREPLGSAPILEFVMRLRAELADLRHLHWGVAQGLAPRALLAELVLAR